MTTEHCQSVYFSSKRPATSHCYDFAKRSLLAAEVQIDRVWANSCTPSDPIDSGQIYHRILIDLHFYFISLNNVYRYLNKVISDPTFTHLRLTLDSLNEKWFKHYSSGRDAFEHIDQRLPGEKHQDRIVEIEENGARRKIYYALRLRKGQFAHSEKEWDISIAAFSQIKTDVEQLLAGIVNASPITKN